MKLKNLKLKTMKRVPYFTLGLFTFFMLAALNCKDTKSSNTSYVIQTRHGDIRIKLFPDIAPKHVESFQKLVASGFYDGTTFHRVIPHFMIQGGDPNSKNADLRDIHGTGGPGYTVPAEFSKLNHLRGVLSAARSSDPNSAGSQFFIVTKDSLHLDGQYSIFGVVESGMEVADKIVNEPSDAKKNPIIPVPMTIKKAEK